jgi:hypothetical protein
MAGNQQGAQGAVQGDANAELELADYLENPTSARLKK